MGEQMGIPVALLERSNVEVTEDGLEVVEEKAVKEEEEESGEGDSDEDDSSLEEEPAETAVTFKVLLRKGAKIQARDLAIPEQNVLAQRVRERQTAEERERQEMRGLVLQKAQLISDGNEDDDTAQKVPFVVGVICC